MFSLRHWPVGVLRFFSVMRVPTPTVPPHASLFHDCVLPNLNINASTRRFCSVGSLHQRQLLALHPQHRAHVADECKDTSFGAEIDPCQGTKASNESTNMKT